MAKTIKYTINGREAETESGKLILQAAIENGIHIPHLCYDTRLIRSNGSCGLCVVTIKEGETERHVKACQTPVLDKMEIITNSEYLENYRKVRLEQILADHNGDCIAPCVNTCPANIDIQAYLRQVANRNFKGAIRIIKDKNPFPLACGRVCPHPCEKECRRNLVDEAVNINHVKRFVADLDIFSGNPYIPARKPDTGKKIAIVGAGPAGLSAAYYSAINGHNVTIFERQSKAGGMLRYGIPEYRLPKKILDKEIELIEKLGVKILYNKSLGVQLRLEDLHKSFDAVFLAVGSWRATELKIEGEKAKNVWLGINYLEEIAKGVNINLGDNVIVIGGGNTAIDCARTALRKGSKNVTLVYRRTQDEMPAAHYEVEEAIHEGVKMVFLSAPVKIEYDIEGDQSVKRVQFIKMKLGEPDRSGRRRPEPIEGSEYYMEATGVIGAIGQSTNTSYLWDDLPVQLNKWGDIKINKKTMQTSIENIFAGGDCVTGPATVVQAVGAGRRAAEAMHEYLTKGFVKESNEDYSCSRGTLEDLPRHEFEARPKIPRAVMKSLPVSDRINNFNEVELGLTEDQAVNEAKRCLQCGCSERYVCDLKQEATNLCITHKKPLSELPYRPIVYDHPFIIRDHNKCISCGRCVASCEELSGPNVLSFYLRHGKLLVGTKSGLPLLKTDCVNCGQCVISCPTGALDYLRESDKVFEALNDKNKYNVAIIAPACRSAVTMYLKIPLDKAVNYMAGLLKTLGFDKVYDCVFTADLTIMEETTEFIERFTKGGKLPMFTSCCPAWVTFVEKRYPELLPHLSTCKSPQQMFGSIIKNHLPKYLGKELEGKEIFISSIMPCIAKKYEASRPEFGKNGKRDIDAVVTSIEVIEMINTTKIDLNSVKPAEFDDPYKSISGAGTLFGASGGVAEAAIRMAYETLSGNELTKLDFESVRGLSNFKNAELNINNKKIRVAVINGLNNVEPLLEKLKNGEDIGYDFIEVMTCPGGCIGGAGHPVPEDLKYLKERQNTLVELDKLSENRRSHKNPDILKLYKEFLGGVNSHLAHELLHTHYSKKDGDSSFIRNREDSVYKTKEIKVFAGGNADFDKAMKIITLLRDSVYELKLSNFITVKENIEPGRKDDSEIYISFDGKRYKESEVKDYKEKIKAIVI